MNRLRCIVILLLLALAPSCAKSSKDKQAASEDATKDPAFFPQAIEDFNQEVEITGAQKDENKLGTGIFDSADGQTLDDVLDECGIEEVNNQEKQIFSTKIFYDYLRVINAGIATADVNIRSILDLRAAIGKSTLNVGVKIGAVAGKYGEETAEDTTAIAQRGEDLAIRFRGPVHNITNENWVNLKQGDIWKKIHCSIIPTERVENLRANMHTQALFNPWIPTYIQPLADATRYEQELGASKVFSDIKATVTATNNPVLEFGKVYLGNVVVERIPPVRQTPAGLIEADTAYRITNRFGSIEETLALGFHVWTEYYIDHDQQNYAGVIADVGDDVVMYFVRENSTTEPTNEVMP